MHVGMNLLYLVRDAGGVGRYVRELIPGLLERDVRITAFASRELPDEDRHSEWGKAVEWVTLGVTVTHGPPWNVVKTLGAQWLAEPWIAARKGIDVVHGPANIAPLLVPRAAVVLSVLDLTWLHRPETLERRAAIGMRLTTPLSARRADRVIAISEAGRDDVAAGLGVARDRIDVTPLGVRVDADAAAMPEQQLRHRLSLGAAPVVLCVAAKRPHKNLAVLIEALPLLGAADAVLVLAGAPTPYEDELKAFARGLGVEHRVRFPAWLEEDELEALYRMATAFVLPSLQEGFGLPALEAMARGVPTACSNTSALPEVAGDGALLFDPRSPQAIASAVDRLTNDAALRESLRRKGLDRAALFTWDRTAQATLASYERAAGGRRSRQR